MIEIIINNNPEAFFCPVCNTKIKPDDENEEEYSDPMVYCEHVQYCYTSEGIDYLSPGAEEELNLQGLELEKENEFISISDPNNEDIGFQDLPKILNAKNIKNYRFSYASTWGLEVNIGIQIN